MASMCGNCSAHFEVRTKGYKRQPLLKEPPSILETVLKTDQLTPYSTKEGYFLCPECSRLLKSATDGEAAKKTFLDRTIEGSYISRKRKRGPHSATPAKKMKFSPTSTPLKKKRKYSAGASSLENSQYERGFRYYLKSKAAKRALVKLVEKHVRKDVKSLFEKKTLQLCGKPNVVNFMSFNWSEILKLVKSNVPFLYSALVGSSTLRKHAETLKRGTDGISLKPAIGCATAILFFLLHPRKASLLQKMNSIQMWRSGAKRSLLKHFHGLGVAVSEKSTLTVLDEIKDSFDSSLKKWKSDLENYVYRRVVEEEEEQEESDESGSDLLPLELEHSSSSDTIESALSADKSHDEDSDTGAASDDVDVQSDVDEQEIPPGYTICWDNVGKHIKSRHHTRNYGNKYLMWALAYVAKNRICTTSMDNEHEVRAADISIETFFPTEDEVVETKRRMVIEVMRVLVRYLKCLQAFGHLVESHIKHDKWDISRWKSEVFNIGVIDENPSSTNGVIRILEDLHEYVPRENDNTIHKIICYGDGLSCERHNDAQNARANGGTALERLEGLETAPQDFHKRMLLVQDTMNQLFDGKSAADKGTLYYLKNCFNQRSVAKDIGDCFNYCNDFLHFVGDGYILLGALQVLNFQRLDDDLEIDIEDWDDNDRRHYLVELAGRVVDLCWLKPPIYSELTPRRVTEPIQYEYCICKEESEGEDVMIKCDNENCEEGEWFHLECVGIDEDSIPDGVWFCSDSCMSAVELRENKRKTRGKGKGKGKKLEEQEESVDRKLEYSKILLLRCLNDRIRRDSIRENDGPMTICYWKQDMVHFFNNNHNKYFVIGHRLICNVSGHLQERLRNDLIWNRTVNLRGGAGHNDEMDLVNEFLNKEFKESLPGVSTITQATLDRHGKLAGGVGHALDSVYETVTDTRKKSHGDTKDISRMADMELFVRLLEPERLFTYIPGRYHKAFPNIKHGLNIKSTDKFIARIKRLSKKLDKRRAIVANA